MNKLLLSVGKGCVQGLKWKFSRNGTPYMLLFFVNMLLFFFDYDYHMDRTEHEGSRYSRTEAVFRSAPIDFEPWLYEV